MNKRAVKEPGERSRKGLQLHKETLRRIEALELGQVVGGGGSNSFSGATNIQCCHAW